MCPCWYRAVEERIKMLANKTLRPNRRFDSFDGSLVNRLNHHPGDGLGRCTTLEANRERSIEHGVIDQVLCDLATIVGR